MIWAWPQRTLPDIPRPMRRGFTLIELLIVIAIIGILSSMTLLMLRRVGEESRASRADAQIQRIESILQSRLEQYETRIIPVRLDSNNAGDHRAFRQRALAELIRAEMPSAPAHVSDVPSDLAIRLLPSGMSYDWSNFPRPSLSFRYLAKGLDNAQHSSQMLYYVLESITDVDDRNGLDYVRPNEIATDPNTGLRFIVDPWGDPLGYAVFDLRDPDNPVLVDPLDPPPLSQIRVRVWSVNTMHRF